MKKIIVAVFLILAAINTKAQSNKIVIETDSGRIVIELYDNTPQHRDNMIKLTKEHFFDSTLFHRIIPNFVIQGGDPDSKKAQPGQMLGDGDLGYLVPAEINDTNFHQRGAVGMARDDNPTKASSACQFYIVVGRKYNDMELDMISKKTGRIFTPEQRAIYKTVGGTPQLDGRYTVFGMVTEGMGVIDKIANMSRNQADRPFTDIAMRKVYMLDERTNMKKKK